MASQNTKFTKTESVDHFKGFWNTLPVVGETMTYGKIQIQIKKIEDETIFWEEIPWT